MYIVVLNTRPPSTPPPHRNPPLTIIKMVHITITSFHINLYANKSYAIDVDTPPSRVLSRTPKFKILENTLNRRHMQLNVLQRGFGEHMVLH